MLNLNTTYIFDGTKDHDPYGLSPEERRKSTLVLGKPGSGKTQVLLNMAIQDARRGAGFAFLDPQGSAIANLLEHIPRSRVNSVILWAPGRNQRFPIGLNLIPPVPKDKRHLVASNITQVFATYWKDFWGPQSEQLLKQGILAQLELRQGTILGVYAMLLSDDYRAHVITQIKDRFVKTFWEKFNEWEFKKQRDAAAPLENKLEAFLGHPVRNIVGQVKSKMDIAYALDHNRIILVDLSRAHLGAENANLLGSLFLTMSSFAAMERQGRPEDTLSDFGIYIDGCHQFSPNSIASLLTDARPYRVHLNLASHSVAQLAPALHNVIFTVGTILAFRVNAVDAACLEAEFAPVNEKFTGTKREFLTLKEFQICGSMDGVLLTEWALDQLGRLYPEIYIGRSESIRSQSRTRFGESRSRVERRISRWTKRWLEQKDDSNQTQKPRTRKKTPTAQASNAGPRSSESSKLSTTLDAGRREKPLALSRRARTQTKITPMVLD
jgi:RecA/RadA recombinase